MKRAAALGGLLAAGLLAGVVYGATRTVHVGTYYFDDATPGDGKVVAAVGDRISFVFDDSKSHSANVDALGIASGPLGQGQVYTTPVLRRPGTFQLYCQLHRSRGHVATLVVTGTAATPAPTPAPTPVPTASAAATAAPTAAPPVPTPAPGDSGAPASAEPGSSAAVVASPDPGSSADPGASPDPATSAEPGDEALPDGGTAEPVWLRSVSLALVAGVPMVLLAAAAFVAARRRAARSETAERAPA